MTEICWMVILAFLLLMSAFNFASEISIITFEKTKLSILKEKKDKRAILIDKLQNKPEKLFSIVLVANNLVTILSGSVATIIGLSAFGKMSVGLASLIVTFLITLLDVIAKTLAVRFYKPISYFLIYPFLLMSYFLLPAIKLFEILTKAISKFLPHSKKESLTKDDLKILIGLATKEGLFDQTEATLIEGVFNFIEKRVGEVMIPRKKIDACSIDTPADKIIEEFLKTGHRRMPVYKQDLDNVLGVIYAKDLLYWTKNQDILTLQDLITKPIFIEEDARIIDLLQVFKESPIHIALVKKNNKIVGLVDLIDLLEEITGKIIQERSRI